MKNVAILIAIYGNTLSAEEIPTARHEVSLPVMKLYHEDDMIHVKESSDLALL